MSIMSEYREIRNQLGEQESASIERYLELHTDVLLSDIYYNQSAWDAYVTWRDAQ